MAWIILFFGLWAVAALFDAFVVPPHRRQAYLESFDLFSLVAIVCAHLIWGVSLANYACPDYQPMFGDGMRVIGAVLFFGGRVLSSLAMSANPYFSASLRYVPRVERVTTGIYRLRHPFYIGCFCTALGMWLLLASSWAYIPYVIYLVLLVFRVSMEEHLLNP